MRTITLRVEPDTLEALDTEADDHGRTRSEHVRQILRTRHEAERLREEIDELRDERDAAEARADDLRRQLQTANSRADDVDELAEYVREERGLRQQEAERERRRREASIIRRAKWWITGEPPADGDGSK